MGRLVHEPRIRGFSDFVDSIIFDCGPSLSEISKKYGCASEWIMGIFKDEDCSFKWVKSYEEETVAFTEGDAWIITGSPCSVYDELNWMLDLEEKIRNAQKFNKPILGICLGLQVFFKTSEEGNEEGLDLIKGKVIKFYF